MVNFVGKRQGQAESGKIKKGEKTCGKERIGVKLNGTL